jgi:hypothetical protein
LEGIWAISKVWNSAAINMGVQVALLYLSYISLCICLEVVSLECVLAMLEGSSYLNLIYTTEW